MLRRLPGLELAIRSAVPAIEEAVFMDNIANSILVGPKQMGSLHGLLVEACRILDMPQVPDLYIRQVNGYGGGKGGSTFYIVCFVRIYTWLVLWLV